MSEPFFDYIRANTNTASNKLYGLEEEEKLYSRVEYLKLPDFSFPNVQLRSAMLARASTRSFTDQSISLGELSQLLGSSIAVSKESKGMRKYTFPSGGGLYPIETYLFIGNVESLTPGVYHYSSVNHSIGLIRNIDDELRQVMRVLLRPMQTDTLPSLYILMSVEKSRCIQKYGSLMYPLTFMEAGHRGQNICLVAAAMGIGCCPIGAPLYDEMNKVLVLDGVSAHYVYGLAVGLAK